MVPHMDAVRCITEAWTTAPRVPRQLLEHAPDMFLFGKGHETEFESATVQSTFGHSLLGYACCLLRRGSRLSSPPPFRQAGAIR